jgi:hypothetical protein
MAIGPVAIAEPDFELRPDRQQGGHGVVEPLWLYPNGREPDAGNAHEPNRSSATRRCHQALGGAVERKGQPAGLPRFICGADDGSAPRS